jgi:hypothetical protein
MLICVFSMRSPSPCLKRKAPTKTTNSKWARGTAIRVKVRFSTTAAVAVVSVLIKKVGTQLELLLLLPAGRMG